MPCRNAKSYISGILEDLLAGNNNLQKINRRADSHGYASKLLSVLSKSLEFHVDFGPPRQLAAIDN